MRIKILGSAAGGGFPQWNCACSNCARFRNHKIRAKARTQVQLACEFEPDNWLLVNASPDLRSQIEQVPELYPRNSSAQIIRQTPIKAVLLTSAELDGVLGLLLMREFQPLNIYATLSVRRVLTETNSIFRMLQRVQPQARWHDITPGENFQVGNVECATVSLGGKFPEYVSSDFMKQLEEDEAMIGVELSSIITNKKVFFAPSVGKITEPILERTVQSEVLLWDGTFWDNQELRRIRGSGKTAKEMGHIPINGQSGSMELLQEVSIPTKLFIHINNTNPVLDEESAEYAKVRAMGWDIAEDGMEFDL